jgi:hypothetical protein
MYKVDNRLPGPGLKVSIVLADTLRLTAERVLDVEQTEPRYRDQCTGEVLVRASQADEYHWLTSDGQDIESDAVIEWELAP